MLDATPTPDCKERDKANQPEVPPNACHPTRHDWRIGERASKEWWLGLEPASVKTILPADEDA
jgi:hypothetical protein